MEEKIVHTALENLRKHTGIESIYTANQKRGLDGEVSLIFQNGKELFIVEVKREVRNHQLEQIKDWATTNKNFLLIAETIFPKIKEELRKNRIGYLDTAGNIFLQSAKHHLWIEGHKVTKTKTQKRNRAFTATGLKVIFLFLLDETLLNEPQRIIAGKAGIALGNINSIINGLKEQNFLIERTKREFQLINKKDLQDKWMIGFEEKLKPTLHMGNFRFLKTEDEKNWRQLKFNQYQTYWGGEPAGALLTQYLVPELFTIYTEETRNNLIKNYRLVPEINGNVRVYKKFWKCHEAPHEAIVHPLLVYTDLMITGNSRCMETAKMIYDKYIKQNI